MRKLVKLALIVGGAALMGRLIAAKKSNWQGLTEAQVRQKLETRLPDRVPEKKRTAIADEVVSKMRQRGVLSEEGQSPGTTGEGTDEGSSSSDPSVDDGRPDSSESV